MRLCVHIPVRRAVVFAALPLVLVVKLGLRAVQTNPNSRESHDGASRAHQRRAVAHARELAGVRTGPRHLAPKLPSAHTVGSVTTVQDTSRAPRNKVEARRILRHFGFTGYTVDAIQPAEFDWSSGQHVVRVWCLTPKVLQANNTWKQEAKTVVLVLGDETVKVHEEDGWIV